MAAETDWLIGSDDASEHELAMHQEFAERVAQLVRPALSDDIVARSWEQVRRNISGEVDPTWASRRPVEAALRRRDPRLTIEDAASGDQDAREVLYERYAKKIHAQLCRRIGPHEAEDLTHEVFEQTWEALAADRYDSSRPFGRWVGAVAMNALIDHLRKHRRVELTDPDILKQLREDHGLALVTDPAVEKALGWMTDDELARAMKLLSPMQRKVLTLTFFAGCSTGQIAGILETSPSSVAKAKSQGLTQLRERYGGRRRKVVQRPAESLASTRRAWRPRRLHGFSLLPRLSGRWV